METGYTTAERLADVNLAIHTVLRGGQSYKLGSRQVTRADLALLKTMRDDLEAQLATGEESHLLDATCVAVFEGR